MVSKQIVATIIVATACGGFASQVVVAPLAHAGPGYLESCSDVDKLAADPVTGAMLVCTGQVWDHAPAVPAGTHAIGTPCQSAGVLSTSDTGYLIFCSSGVWTLYHP